MRWTSSDALVVKTGDGHELVLYTDPLTGEPVNRVNAGELGFCGD